MKEQTDRKGERKKKEEEEEEEEEEESRAASVGSTESSIYS